MTMFSSLFSQILEFRPRKKIYLYLIGLVCVAAAIICYALFPLLTQTTESLFLFLYLAVMFATVVGGLRAGLITLSLGLIYSALILYQPQIAITPSLEQRTIFFVAGSLVTAHLLSLIKNTYHISMAMLNTLYSYVVILSPDGEVVDVNKATQEKFGLVGDMSFDRSQPGRLWELSDDSYVKFEQAFPRVLSGETARFDVKIEWVTGELQFLDCSMAPIFEPNGSVINIVICANDVTSRVLAEREVKKLNTSLQQKLNELRRSELRFARLVNSNLIGVVVVNLKTGLLVDANEAFSAMTGYTQEDVKAKSINWFAITPETFNEADQKAFVRMKEMGETKPYEKAFVKSDGSVLPVLIGIAQLEEVGEMGIAFVVDISARKKLERRKDEFIGLASHELKTPLTSVKVYTQLLEKALSQNGESKNMAFIGRINQQLDRLTALIEDLLDISRIESGKLTFSKDNFDVNEMVQECVNDVQAVAEKHQLIIKGKVKNQLCGDKYRLSQVVTNLLTNAIKYSPSQEQIEISLKESPSEVTIAVKDQGIGIPPQHQARLFEKFYRAEGKNRHSFPGLGLGLYLSKEIIDRHNGKIWLESKEGKGSTFFVSIPKEETTS